MTLSADGFEHRGFKRVFPETGMTVGLMFPIESYAGAVPEMKRQTELARAAEAGGFAALWARDVPLLDHSFGDAGQMYDPWVWLTHIGAHTDRIALGTASLVLPLRHPLHVAKAAASLDLLTGGRLLLGVATGDRPIEFPLFGARYASRGEMFRQGVDTLRVAWSGEFPKAVAAAAGGGDGLIALLPKPAAGRVPVLVTGRSQQEMSWLARNADGWLTYPRPASRQREAVLAWHKALAEVGRPVRPFAQSLYIDLVADRDARPAEMHLGFRLGRNALLDHLRALRDIGVGHVMLNLKYGRRPAAEVVGELAEHVVPNFA
jgi:luciferase-type oxidoreductase